MKFSEDGQKQDADSSGSIVAGRADPTTQNFFRCHYQGVLTEGKGSVQMTSYH
jgi:hypothetical protein